ncbi:MAG: trehalose-6-phosphate synthase, partial [Deltaproteobacteria bacterium]|nr:trehalose-6-phosphate synthase [Deltaproteobacteria bacterium]
LLKPVTREVEKLTARLRAAKETAREVSKERQVSDLWTPARLKAHAVTHLGDNPFIVVSNREPYMHVKEHGQHKVIIPASGLVTSLDPVLRATSGLWIAHGAGDGDRDTVDREGKVLVPPQAPSYTLKRLWLTREEEEGYYYGFSNEALWPLCHLTNHRPEFEEKDWLVYRKVNEKFADAVVREFGKTKPFVLYSVADLRTVSGLSLEAGDPGRDARGEFRRVSSPVLLQQLSGHGEQLSSDSDRVGSLGGATGKQGDVGQTVSDQY